MSGRSSWRTFFTSATASCTVVVTERARPTGSTGRVQLRYAAVVVIAEEMIGHAKTYPDIDEARAAAERLAQERG
jgi:hypothetical protein